MKQEYPIHSPQFFTATIYEWKHLLINDTHKDIIVDSLQFLVTNKRIELMRVNMSNHIHLIWQPLFDFNPSAIQASFMKHIAKQLKLSLMKNDEAALDNFKVDKHDREYQFWKREPLSIELITELVFRQKMEYIHFNPVRADFCESPEDYNYSSARFYHDGTDCFNMLTHFSGN